MDRNGRAELSALEEFCAWTGSDFEFSDCYRAVLDNRECAELQAVVPRLQDWPVDRRPLRRAEVPLGGLTGRLADWRNQVVFGRGFVLVRRLPTERMRDQEIALAFAGLCAHLGRARLAEGFAGPQALNGADCQRALGSGQADLTALLCVREPADGFKLRLASAITAHNALLMNEPRHVAALYESYRSGAKTGFCRSGNQLMARLSPCEAAALAPQTGKALEAVLDIADRHALDIDFEPGDILVLNNNHVLFALRGLVAGHENGAQILRLELESALVAARPIGEQKEAPRAVRDVESQAA